MLSVLLVAVLVLGAMPASMLNADIDVADGFRDVSAVLQKGSELTASASDDAELALEKLDLADIDTSGIDTRLLDAKGVNAKSVLTTAIDAGIDTESLGYVEAVAEALVDPVGIVDVEGSGTKYVFVWLQTLPDALERVYQQHGVRNARYETARSHGRSARSSIRNSHRSQITYEYSEVFSGFAMEADIAQLEQIAAMEGVYAITEVGYEHMDYIPDPEYVTPGNAGARELFELNDLHAAGIDGRNVKVGVIDSGIDMNHPDLKDAYKGGYNFAPRNNTLNPTGRSPLDPARNTPDGDHGTHVSGIIASQGLVSLGMAPGVDLYMAQVFTPANTNSASQADITAALEAFSGGNPNPQTYPSVNLPKVDVVNMSLGNDVNTAYSADHFARNNAVIAGVMVVISAGNNAYPDTAPTQRNNYTLGSGGVSLPMSVAASKYGGNPQLSYDPTVTSANGVGTFSFFCENGDAALAEVFFDNAFGNPVPSTFTYGPLTIRNDGTLFDYPRQEYTIQPLEYVDGLGYELYYACANNAPTPPGTTGSDMTDAELRALNALPAGALSGKILVVNRGQAFFDYKGQALRLGAGGLIVINRADEVIGNLNIGSETSAYEMLIFSAPSSFKYTLYNLVQDGATAYLSPGALSRASHPPEPTGFSSIGPVNETAELKPDIIAPGYNVLSTSLDGGYTEMGGTSMSSPCVAGLAALVKQVYPNATPAEIKARLMNTADPFLLHPSTSNLTNNGTYYYDAEGSEISVFEQGAGFVNPKRAVLEDVYITVYEQIPTGETNRNTMMADMASFSFGAVDQGVTTQKLTATVHGGEASDIEVVYNKDTRYSNKNDGAVEVFYENNGGTFDVWLAIDENANCDPKDGGNLYEGYILVTVDGNEYVLPWAVRVGEAFPDDDWLLFPDRPVQATYNNANQDFGPYSSRNYIYFSFWGTGLTDTVVLRTTSTGSGSNRTYTYYMDIILFNVLTEKPSYRYSVTLASGVRDNSLKLSDFIDCDGSVYQVSSTAQAYAMNANGAWASTLSSIAAGSYYIGLEFSNNGRNYYNWYLQLGVTFSNTRPTVTLYDIAGVGDFTLNNNYNVPFLYPYGGDEVTVSGQLYSAATEEAANAGRTGFYWAGYYVLMYDEILILDQSLNVFVDPGSGWELEFYDEEYGVYHPWLCDEDGYFSLTFDVQDDGWFFPEDICESGYAYCADAFDVSNATGKDFLAYGCLASYYFGALTFEDDPEIEVISVELDNIAGTLTAWFLYQDGEIPEEIDVDLLSAVLYVDGEEDDALVYEGYDAETGAATWTFVPYKYQTFSWVDIEATVTYEQYWITTSASDTDISIHLISAAASAKVDKLNGNQNRLNITVKEVYSDGSPGEEFLSLLINSNSAGNYVVGPYTVYVDTKGNDQIRACDIIVYP